MLVNNDWIKINYLDKKDGLNFETAQKVAEIIYSISDLSAVTIMDTEQVLAYVGEECEKHPKIGMPIINETTFRVLRTGKMQVVSTRGGFHCDKKGSNCPLESAVIAPLILDDEIIGTIKLYHPTKGNVPEYVLKLAVGAAQLLSMQVELAEKEFQKQLTAQAQLDALRARINPHFLFNTLNTISMLIRTDAEKARQLLLNFSSYFRNSLKSSDHLVRLYEEMENVRNYMELEKARFGEKIKLNIDIEEGLLNAFIPILSIQPIVENSVNHGIVPKSGDGNLSISAFSIGEKDMKIVISDDGVGIKADILPFVKNKNFTSGSGMGVGLDNVDKRLRMIYGDESGVVIDSEEDSGTMVSFTIDKTFDIDERS